LGLPHPDRKQQIEDDPMMHPEIERLSRYDALWLSPHPYDALVSGTARLLRGAAQGQRTLLVTVFGETRNANASAVLRRLEIDHIDLKIDPAPARSRHYRTFASRLFGSDSTDAECHERLWRLVEDIGHRSRARDVYLPLGVGSDIDHRLLHDAGARVFPVGPSQNVFLYEDRPFALAPGSVRLRLAALAARLPPALIDVGDRSGFVRHLHALLGLPVVRRNLRGLKDRLRCVWLEAAAWRRARGWQPRKAFGLRLQPVTDRHDPGTVSEILQVLSALGTEAAHLTGPPRAARRMAAAYARRLGWSESAERYWLLLPPRDTEGVGTITEPDLGSMRG
jgi:hypothetical protein